MELTEWKEKALDTIKGDLTITKLDFFLIGAICLLAGICIGFLTAPLTHGIAIGSNNGSHNTGNGCHKDSENGKSDNHMV